MIKILQKKKVIHEKKQLLQQIDRQIDGQIDQVDRQTAQTDKQIGRQIQQIGRQINRKIRRQVDRSMGIYIYIYRQMDRCVKQAQITQDFAVNLADVFWHMIWDLCVIFLSGFSFYVTWKLCAGLLGTYVPFFDR